MNEKDIQTLIQFNKRIHTLATTTDENPYIKSNDEEIASITHLIEDILSQPRISVSEEPEHELPTRFLLQQEMLGDLEMTTEEILLLGRAQHVSSKSLSGISTLELSVIYNEAKDLYEEGLLRSYLDHLLAQEEKHDGPPPKPKTSPVRVSSY